MSIVERMARAISAEFENRPGYAQMQMNGVLAQELALAALEAIKEPSPGMVKTAAEKLAEYDGWGSLEGVVNHFGAFNDKADYLAMANKAGRAMIQAAIDEHKRGDA